MSFRLLRAGECKFMSENIWSKKGASLSHKSAYKEFGLTFDEIITAINEGKLQFIETSIYGNPFFRLLRHEVEALVIEKFGKEYLNKKKAQNELTQVKKELKELKARIQLLEQRKIELLQILD